MIHKQHDINLIQFYFCDRRRRHVAEAGQRHRQGPFRWFGRCFPVRHACGACAPGPRRQAGVSSQPVTSTLPAHRQQTSHEAVRLKKSSHERAHQTEGGGPLGHTSMQ